MYCCIIWHFCSISDTNKIEKMQLKALRHIYNAFLHLCYNFSDSVVVVL